jgi:hypothetical protein
MDDREIEALQRKLKKRGFITDGVREHCDRCEQKGEWIYKIYGRVGGRDIRWCLACGSVRSWRRTSDDHLVEEQGFDLKKFLD